MKNWLQRAHLSESSSLFSLVMWKMREGDLSLSSVTGSVIYPFLIHLISPQIAFNTVYFPWELHCHGTAPVGRSRHWDRSGQAGTAGMVLVPLVRPRWVPARLPGTVCSQVLLSRAVSPPLFCGGAVGRAAPEWQEGLTPGLARPPAQGVPGALWRGSRGS